MTLLTSRENLDDHVDTQVTIQGEVSNTKLPQILGVEIGTFNVELRGKLATATGVLKKIIVTEEDIKRIDAKFGGKVTPARRGAGTFYRLVDPKTDMIAQAREVEK